MPSRCAGLFGHMLPAFDRSMLDSRPDSQPSSSKLPASSTNPPYQLPPPRASPALLPLGTDPFLSQHIPSKRSGYPVELPSNHTKPPPPLGNEPLPSVSQLLTDTSPSPIDAAHCPPPVVGTSSPSHDSSALNPSHHYEYGLSHQLSSQSFGLDVSNSPPAFRSLRQEENLPPISHVAFQNPENERRRSSAASMALPPQPLQHHHVHYPSSEFHDLRQPRPEFVTLNRLGNPPTPSSHPPTFPEQPPKHPIRPHVVDEQYVEGEGLCYIYADGSHCPKSIDGIPVNANWGITKAGKPRKRLAQACLTCREKKIKCQPNLPKCEQCQKSGRQCRFENAPRGNRASCKASHIAPHTHTKDRHSSCSHSNSCPPTPLYSLTKASNSSTSLPGTSSSPSPVLRAPHESSTLGNMLHNKLDAELECKTRTSNKVPRLNGDFIESAAGVSEPNACPDYSELLMEAKDIDPGDPLASDWNTDPYEADPESTNHYIENYFTHINDALYYVFPRARFFLWVRSCRTKSLVDKMLLYSMMTLGSVFSDRPAKMTALKRYSRTAQYAAEHSQHIFTLQLAQTRIIMSLWYYAIGALVKAWDSIGAAVRTVCGLRYNVELGGVTAGQTEECEYGLHPQALIECRRRTFWTAFLIERLSSLYSPSSTFIPSQTALLRLPCREEIYEAQEYGTAPYFHDYLNQTPSSAEEGLSGLSSMAFLIGIVSLWSEVSQHVFYSPHIPAEAYSQQFKEFHASIVRRTEEWAMELPAYLTFTPQNLERSIRSRKADALVTIHLLYHLTLMKLNRHVRYQNIPSGTVDQYIHNARLHAIEILHICITLHQYYPAPKQQQQRQSPALSRFQLPAISTSTTTSEKNPTEPTTPLLNPFLAYVILAVTDVLSAAGLTSTLPDTITLLTAGLETVRTLTHHWTSTILLASLIENRIDSLRECLALVHYDNPHPLNSSHNNNNNNNSNSNNDNNDNSNSSSSGRKNSTATTGSTSELSPPSKLGFVFVKMPLHTRVRVGSSTRQPTGAINQDLLYGGLPRDRLLKALGLDVVGELAMADCVVCVGDRE